MNPNLTTEKQNVEFKESWRDEYLKWICGFANAHGGILYIGVKDNGKVCGVENPKRLMEEIPNKVRDLMGIFVEVNLLSEDGVDYLEVRTEKCPFPVSYKGKFYQRCGATNQEMKGPALTRFLLRSQNLSWDKLPEPTMTMDKIDKLAIAKFREHARHGKRMSPEELQVSDEELVEKLKLVDEESGCLKKAAALLFSEDPEDFYTGAYIKIGYFQTNADILYQDEVRGNLFRQVDDTVDLIRLKYMKALIRYHGLQRIDEYPVAYTALREVILNSVIHKDYGVPYPTQISVYDDKIMIWNAGALPPDWTTDTLLGKHTSEPYNPLVAKTFYRAGDIESWGRGMEKVIEACEENDFPKPVAYTQGSGLWVVFNYSDAYVNKLRAINRGEKIWFDPENGMGNGSLNGTVKQFDPQNETINSQNETITSQNETINGKDETLNPKNETIIETINGKNETVSQMYLQIIACVAENDDVKSQLLLQQTGVSRATLFRAITYLSSDEIHFLMRQGARRNGCYVLTEEGQLFYDEVIKPTRR